MGILQDLLNSPLGAKILIGVFFVNLALSSLNSFLGKLAAYTGNQTESKISQLISEACSGLQSLLSVVGFNPPNSIPMHKKRLKK